MTIDRALRRGIFPILSERPLDESNTPSVASGKVYVVEVGAYSDRYIDAIFTTRELAEAFVLDRQKRAFARDGRKAHRKVTGWRWGSIDHPGGRITFGDGIATTEDGRTFAGAAEYIDVRAETFDEFLKRHTWNEFGDVDEYDIWDVVPVAVAPPEPTE